MKLDELITETGKQIAEILSVGGRAWQAKRESDEVLGHMVTLTSQEVGTDIYFLEMGINTLTRESENKFPSVGLTSQIFNERKIIVVLGANEQEVEKSYNFFRDNAEKLKEDIRGAEPVEMERRGETWVARSEAAAKNKPRQIE